ncbi:MAG: hypothetical protein L6Q37_03475 [Bdellovibrionaceae bacterium]|nr:hypothetical protein [Pseudobdellovibrionaceae bacterium]
MTTESRYTVRGNRKAVMPSARDRAMIEFLWNHRVASFRTLYKLFYQDSNPRTCYNRLYRFRKYGFISVETDDGTRGRYYTLDRRGLVFFAKENGRDLQAISSRPQSFKHDHLSSVVLLGEWCLKTPYGATIITEQEILSSSQDVAGFLKTDSRRPDGIWQFEIGTAKKFVALEVEIHAKTEADYVEIIKSYDNYYAIDKIVWVIRGKGLMEKIHKLAIKHSSFKVADHLFLSVDDVLKDLWLAKFKNKAMQDVSLSEFLNSYLVNAAPSPMKSLGNSLGKSCQTDGKRFITSDLLNLSFPLLNSRTYSKQKGVPKP